MNTDNAVEICEGEDQSAIDGVSEQPQAETVEPYEVKAYVSYEKVSNVDKELHIWMAKQMLEKDPEIFTRKVRSPIFYKLLSISEDGHTGVALTNEPNVSHTNFFITVNERTVYADEVLHFVTSNEWQMRAHAEHHLTEEEQLELKRRHARVDEREAQRKLEEERIKQLKLDNTPTADTPFELAAWNVLVSDKDFPVTEKYAAYKQVIADNVMVFGWWDGEEYFSNHHGQSPIVERKPDFQLVSIDETTKQVTIKEFTPCPVSDKENYSLSFVLWVDYSDLSKKITGVAGMYLLDMKPYQEAKAIFDEQQTILKTLKGSEPVDGGS